MLPLVDLTPECPESVQLALLDDPDYDLGAARQATVFVRNSETSRLIAGTNLTFVSGSMVPETTELPVLTAEVLAFGASCTIVHSEPHPPSAHTFGLFSWTPLLTQVGPHEVVFRVTVLANRPRVLTGPGPLSVAGGQTLTFQVSAASLPKRGTVEVR